MPEGVIKKYAVIKHLGKPIFVADIVEGDSLAFTTDQREASNNLAELLLKQDKVIEGLNNKIDKLQHEINVIKGEEE